MWFKVPTWYSRGVMVYPEYRSNTRVWLSFSGLCHMVSSLSQTKYIRLNFFLWSGCQKFTQSTPMSSLLLPTMNLWSHLHTTTPWVTWPLLWYWWSNYLISLSPCHHNRESRILISSRAYLFRPRKWLSLHLQQNRDIHNHKSLHSSSWCYISLRYPSRMRCWTISFCI